MAEADIKLNSIARLWRILEIDETPLQDMYILRKHDLQETLVEIIRGAILVASLEPSQVSADANYALQLLTQPQTSLYSFIKDSDESKANIRPDWALAREFQFRTELLVQALNSPVWFVFNFAISWLWECADRDTIRHVLKEVVAYGGGYALRVVAQVASELWKEEAADIVLSRLESRFTEDCVPLVKVLGEILDETSRTRAEPILLKALKSEQVDMVKAVLHSIGKLELDGTLLPTIKECYQWWLEEGPQDPTESGVVPQSAGASLLEHLIAKHLIGFDELKMASKAKRSDIRGVAIKEISQLLAKQADLFTSTIHCIKNGELSHLILDELSRTFPEVCRRHQEAIAQLLDSQIQEVKIACIRVLGDGWADYHYANEKLFSVLSSLDPFIRDEAVVSLRRLEGQQGPFSDF